jgi:hypothetical protein
MSQKSIDLTVAVILFVTLWLWFVGDERAAVLEYLEKCRLVGLLELHTKRAEALELDGVKRETHVSFVLIVEDQ